MPPALGHRVEGAEALASVGVLVMGGSEEAGAEIMAVTGVGGEEEAGAEIMAVMAGGEVEAGAEAMVVMAGGEEAGAGKGAGIRS